MIRSVGFVMILPVLPLIFLATVSGWDFLGMAAAFLFCFGLPVMAVGMVMR